MAFMQGIELCKRFHDECIEPLLARQFPSLLYTSSLIGPGSEVLGFDTEMSMDHDWGPRVVLFLQAKNMDLAKDIQNVINTHCPQRFYGFHVDLNQTVITSLAQFLQLKLAIDVEKELEALDWLTFPSQVLAEVVGGEIFRDDGGQLTRIRTEFMYYPHDVWLYMMASVWNRIGQEEHLMLRAGYIGDELGSSVIGSRLVRDIMNLCFLMERRYAPYPKWFGTAFKTLDCASELLSVLHAVQSSMTWRERESSLCRAYEILARMHNRLGISETVSEQVSPFYERPYNVIHGSAVANSIISQITDPMLCKLSQKRLVGGIDQVSDNTDFISLSQWCQQPTEKSVMRDLYNKILES
ncbi:DUF4037 domain-containing protein [Paenibacillus sp. 1011MAR3C5]|uniref:DUF4037 domain-containing protein n=1 Tax=Paenibacillus sp. 1011MAR3C5 TaxID=1675787 RepID=UPI000E6B969A|nr:DUF4037 domain-containing protein [Paenibacillus sp. 1011MAR3C5]RJE90254.1 DUF4037 domain-containing protein [Paenibacillus sp. 1011MAR3C5]